MRVTTFKISVCLTVVALVTTAVAEDRRIDSSSLRVMTINTYFMWDGVEPEEGSSQINIPWRLSPIEAEEHMRRISDLIARNDPDIVNLVEIENLHALTTLRDEFLSGRGYEPYFVQGRDTFTGQDMGLLSRIDPDGGFVLRSDEPGRSGNVRKIVSKHYFTTITVGDIRILFVGLHFLAFPTDANRAQEREAQADAIRSIVLNNRCVTCEVIVLGDFNDYEGQGGSVDHNNNFPITDVLEIVRELDPSDPNDDLINVASFIPKVQRFTAFHDIDGNRQVDPPLELTSIDHILVSPGLAARIKTVQIDHDVNPVRTSPDFDTDHFPIIARFELDSSPSFGPQVRIKALLPNPAGDESRYERATLENVGTEVADLTGWLLADRAGRSWQLDALGAIWPGERKTIRRRGQDMAMNNAGDTIELRDPSRNVVHSVTYGRVGEGQLIIVNE